MPGPSVLSTAVRVHQGEFLGVQVFPYYGQTWYGWFWVLNDDGTETYYELPTKTFTAGSGLTVMNPQPLQQSGWITRIGGWGPTAPGIFNWGYIRFIIALDSAGRIFTTVGAGNDGPDTFCQVGHLQPDDGALYVFQGTVAEDATVGTHVTTATFTFAAAVARFEVISAGILVGNTSTAQTAQAYSTDNAGNVISYLFNAEGVSATTASLFYPIPPVSTTSVIGSTAEAQATAVPVPFGSTMKFVLQVSTSAVSVTQTFSAVLRVRSLLPTVTLADNTGTPTLTTNTSRCF